MSYYFKELISDVCHWQFYKETNRTEQKIDFIHILPNEIAREIFSHLDLASLGKICLVSKEWKRIASEPNLWKTLVYKELAFGNDKWAKCFGKEIVKDEDFKEEFSSLPLIEFIEDCKKFKSVFPLKSAKDRLMLIRLPKTLNGSLNINCLLELAKKHFPEIKLFISNDVKDYHGDKSIEKSHWVIMTKDILPESRAKKYTEQQDVILNLSRKGLIGYEMPEGLEAITYLLSQCFNSYINSNYNEQMILTGHKNIISQIFSSHIRVDSYLDSVSTTFTRCQDNVKGQQIIIGDFNSNLFYIMTMNIAVDSIGVAAVRKF